MPNGEFIGQIPLPVPDVELAIPGVPKEATSFGALIDTVAGFIGGLFGGGGKSPGEILHDAQVAEAVANREANIAELQSLASRGNIQAIENLLERFGPAGLPAGVSPITGRVPIPTPEQGGPELITERFQTLPPILDVPGLVQEEGVAMPVDVPLLTSSFLPALRQATTPAVTGFLGGLAQDVVSGLFARPLGELGLGQVPAPRAPGIPGVQGLCPPEKPHTRILRFIKQTTGVSINLSRAKSLIRELGLEAAARCLGVTAQEVCQLLIVASPRRRRGISASDIRIVRRTARRFENLKHDLGHLGGRVHHHRRGPHRRHAHK